MHYNILSALQQDEDILDKLPQGGHQPLCWMTVQQLSLWTLRHWGKTQYMLGWRGTWPSPQAPSGTDRPHLKPEYNEWMTDTHTCTAL